MQNQFFHRPGHSYTFSQNSHCHYYPPPHPPWPHPPGSKVKNVFQLSLSVEELLGIVSRQSYVTWNGAQQLYDVGNVVWRGGMEWGQNTTLNRVEPQNDILTHWSHTRCIAAHIYIHVHTEQEITVKQQIFSDHFMLLSDQRIIWSAIMSEQ